MAAPVSVNPLAVTVLPAPTLAVSNVAEPALQLTTSLPTTPVSVQLVTVALVEPSYALFAAAIAGVTDFLLTVSGLVPDEALKLESPADDAVTPVA